MITDATPMLQPEWRDEKRIYADLKLNSCEADVHH